MPELSAVVDTPNYRVLARSTRPQRLENVVGHKLTVEALRQALSSRQIHHALLFSGPRGVGKTSLGRILAKCLLCQRGTTPDPCDACEACRQIEAGQYADFVELDAASHTKIEDTLAILERIPFRPNYGALKIYLIDEVHMLSRHSFNALLKTLEEPPSHVQFILATTELEKIPLTVQSRCLHFSLAPLSTAEISDALKEVLSLQFPTWRFEQAALELLAEQASGSLRDGLTLLDRFQLFHKPLTRSLVEQVLLLFDRKQLLLLLKSLATGALTQVFAVLDGYQTKGCSWIHFFKEIQIILHRLMLLQIDETLEAEEHFREVAKIVSSQALQHYFNLAVKGARDLEFYATPRIGVDLFILRAASLTVDSPPSKGKSVEDEGKREMEFDGEMRQIEQNSIVVNHKPTSDLIAAKLCLQHEKELALRQDDSNSRCESDQKNPVHFARQLQPKEDQIKLAWLQFLAKRQEIKEELQRLFCLQEPWAATLHGMRLPRLLRQVLWESMGTVASGVVTIHIQKRHQEMVDQERLLKVFQQSDATIQSLELVVHDKLETSLAGRYQRLRAKHIAKVKEKILQAEVVQSIMEMFRVRDKKWIYLV